MKLYFKIEYPCGLKKEVSYKGILASINFETKPIPPCPIHNTKCSKK